MHWEPGNPQVLEPERENDLVLFSNTLGPIQYELYDVPPLVPQLARDYLNLVAGHLPEHASGQRLPGSASANAHVPFTEHSQLFQCEITHFAGQGGQLVRVRISAPAQMSDEPRGQHWMAKLWVPTCSAAPKAAQFPPGTQ